MDSPPLINDIEVPELLITNDNSKRRRAMEKVTTLGIDLAKNSFQLHRINAEGKVILRK